MGLTMKHALLKDGVVVNTIEAPEDWTPPEGFSIAPYDPEAHRPTPPKREPRTLQAFEFYALFSAEERVRYRAASEAGNDAVNDLREMLWLATGVRLEGNHTLLVQGLHTLRKEGVIDSDARRDGLIAYLAGA